MTKDKGEVVGVAKIPLFQNNSTTLSEGRSKQELVKIEKNGTEKPVRFLLDYSINYLNVDQLNKKVYDPSKGLKIFINELTNYREKFDVTYQFQAMIGNQQLKNNYGQPCVVAGEDFVAGIVKEKKVQFKESHFIPLDLEKLIDFNRRRLDEIYLLFEIIVDKSEGKGTKDIEEEYGWYAHRLFIDSKPNLGKFNEQLYKLPKEIDVQPIDPKKMKKYLIKFDFEIQQEQGQLMQSQLNSTNNQLVRSKTSKDPSINLQLPPDNADNKFNIYIDQLTKIKFKQNVTTKLAIMFGDEVFPNDKGQPCSFTGDSTKPDKSDVLLLTEEYDIDLDLEVLKSKYPKQLDSFIFFINILDESNKTILWYVGKVFDKDKLKEGTFNEPMFEPPVVAKFSQGTKSSKKSTTFIQYEVKKGHSSDQSFEEQ